MGGWFVPVANLVVPAIVAYDVAVAIDGSDLAAFLYEASPYEMLTIVAQGFTLLAVGVAVALVSTVTRSQAARIERRVISPAD